MRIVSVLTVILCSQVAFANPAPEPGDTESCYCDPCSQADLDYLDAVAEANPTATPGGAGDVGGSWRVSASSDPPPGRLTSPVDDHGDPLPVPEGVTCTEFPDKEQEGSGRHLLH